MENQELITTTGTETKAVTRTTTCFICNDKLFDPDYKTESNPLSVISQLFHTTNLAPYQSHLATEVTCVKCAQILGSVLDLYTRLQKIQAEIKQNRCLVKNLITNAYLQNSTTTTTNPKTCVTTDKNDEFCKQRLALQDAIIHRSDGNSAAETSSVEKSTLFTIDKNPTTDVKVLEVHEIHDQVAAPDSRPRPTCNLKQIITYQPTVKVSRMPILDQLIRKSKSTAFPYHRVRQDVKLLPRPNNRMSPPQRQIKIERKTPTVKSEKAEVYKEVEEVELITPDLDNNDDDDDLDWVGDNNFDDDDYDPSSEMQFNPCTQTKPAPRRKAGASKLTSGADDKDEFYNFFCTICGKPFKTHEYAKKHTLTHNPGEKPFKCTIEGCGVGFFHPRELRKHVRRIHELRNNKEHRRPAPASAGPAAVPPRLHCPECPRTFSTTREEIFQIHVESHKPADQRIKNYSCHMCGHEFFSHARLRQHLRRVHDPSFKSIRRKAQCPICGLQVGKLSRHLRVHSETKPFTCPTCNASFRAKNTLIVHMRIHSDTRPYSCATCPANFRTSNGLKRHVFVHSEERSFACEHCGKAFRLKSSLTEHLHIHLQVKPHRCNVCGRRYKEKGELDMHRDDHTHEKIDGKVKRSRPEWITSTKGGQGQGRLSRPQGLRLPPYHQEEDEDEVDEEEEVELVQQLRFITPSSLQAQQQYPTSSSTGLNNNKFVTYQIQYPHS